MSDNTITNDYVKQLEENDRYLREKLDHAHNIIDRMDDNPLQESMSLMIETSLKYQKSVKKHLMKFKTDEFAMIRIALPRQIGLSTCIVRACKKFFADVHILNTVNAVKIGKEYHKSVNDIPNDVSCIIVDPWSVKYLGDSDWIEIKEKLLHKLDKTKPFLLILVG